MPSLPSNTPQEFLGIGLYAVTDAAQLLKVPAKNIRRWLGGYSYRDGKITREVPPLWIPDLPRFEDRIELSFRDLIELRFVQAFVEAGLGLKTIRNALHYARDVVSSDRPFSTSKFRTDGRSIFLESLERTPEAELEPRVLNLRTRQFAFKQVIERTFKDLDLEDDEVSRWRPYKGKDTIVVDPARSFGKPIAADFGVPTAALAESVEAEGSEDRVAALYEVPVGVVRDAVLFERQLRSA